MKALVFDRTRPFLAAAGLLVLAACDPAIPDSAAGVGDDTSPFNPPPAVEAGATINGDPLFPQGQVSETNSTGNYADWQSTGIGQSAAASPQSYDPAADIAAETAAALSAAGSNSGVAPVEASPSNPAPQLIGNPGLSDENDFDAVASRQTIESDAERLRQLRAQRVEVAPTAVPQRNGDVGPNIVQYALTTANPVGQRIYSRAGINLRNRSLKNCAEFASADLAQIAFLEEGGPKRDRRALDPDGDGYACGWDPRPYRAAVQSPNLGQN